jgi:PAS domain S-box-containing protein
MELAASAAELGMWMWDIVRDEIWITDKGRDLFGLAPSEKLDLNRFQNMIHPEDRESVLQLLENSLRTGAEYRSEYRAVLPNGQIRWIAGRGHVEFDEDGQPVRMRGCSLDITKRRRVEEQLRIGEATLRESKERIDLATKAAGLVVWTWDIPRDEVWLSNKDRALFGFSQGEKLTAERIRSVVHPEDRQLVRQLSEDALRTGEEIETQYRVLLPDGRVRWVTRRGRVEFDADGKPFRERGVLMDITTRKEAELEAACHRNEMAHLSRVTMLGELSGSIAHELTQPLCAILSNAQAAQRILANGDANRAELRQILDEVVSEDKRASEVIRRLRLWLKKGEVQQHSLRINKVVRDVLNLLRSDLINQKVTVDCKLARNLPTVTGDPVQLQQVLVNLVVNACDAMADCDTPERRLFIRTGIENDGGAVIVSATDRGTSIPEEKVEQIFEPFFTTKPKGMGLGLSVCRTIIAAHRGKLWATNNADRGATFHFSLPIDGSEVTNN